MILKLKILFWIVSISAILMFVAACTPTPTAMVTQEATLIPPSPTLTFTPTLTSPTLTIAPTITLTPAPTNTPTPSPTPFGGGSGNIIYTEGWAVYSYNLLEKNAVKIADNCVWNMAFSSDGHYIACSEFKYDNAGSPGTYGITLIDMKTKRIVKSFFDGENMGDEDTLTGELLDVMAFSPDNTQIAFVGKIKETRGVYIVDIETSAYKLVYENPLASGILWSPDGSKLVVGLSTTSQHCSTVGYYVIDADGSNLLNVKCPNIANVISWGKDNNTVFIGDQGIDLKTLKPNGEISHADSMTVGGETIHIGSFPSPDGKYYFDLNRSATLISSDGSRKTEIPGYINHKYSQWSSDSKFLYYYHYNEKTMYSLNIETFTSTVLVKIKIQGYMPDIVWLPDATGFVFTQTDGNGGFEVCFSDVSGNITKLANTKYSAKLYLEPVERMDIEP